MKLNPFLFPLLSAVLLLSGCDSGGGSSGPKNPITVLVMGDSQSSGGNYAGVPSWPALLAAEKSEWRVVNQSVPGATSGNGVGRIGAALSRNSPDVVVIMYGANDAIQSLSVDAYEANISNMVAAALARGARVVVVDIMPFFGARTVYNGTAEAMSNRLSSVASRPNVRLARLRREFRAAGPELFPDGLHPNLDATRIMLVTILDEINRAASGL